MSCSRLGIEHDRKDTFSGVRVHVSPGSAETLVARGGITNHYLIAYSLTSRPRIRKVGWRALKS